MDEQEFVCSAPATGNSSTFPAPNVMDFAQASPDWRKMSGGRELIELQVVKGPAHCSRSE